MESDRPVGVANASSLMTVAGRYRLLALVGSGGMGRVWRAHDELLDRTVAVKELSAPDGESPARREAAQSRAVAEARAAARLDHPGVVRIFDVVRTTGRSWIVMEYVPSRSLHQVIAGDGRLTHQEAARVGVAVLQALQAAHAVGVLHRDVKPHNVLIADDGRVVLTDFGLAVMHRPPVHDGHVEPVYGSPDFIAPERARDGTSSIEADLWSLGATLYTAVEGRPPFSRRTVAESLAARRDQEPDRPRRAGPLHDVITALLAPHPAARPRPADALLALRGVAERPVGVVPAPRAPADDAAPAGTPPARTPPAGTPPAGTRPAGTPPAAGSRRRRRALPAVAAAAATVVVALAAAGALTRHDDDPPGPATATATTAVSGACPAAPRQLIADTSAPVPVPVPDGWQWHVDPTGFRLLLPRGWTRADAPGLVCFGDPDGVRSLDVASVARPVGGPLAHWQAAEQAALGNATLPGYRRVSMGVLLVTGGGADWEYTWQPASGPRLHVRRTVLSAGPARSYALSWTSADRDWASDVERLRTALSAFRDSDAASPWAVQPPA